MKTHSSFILNVFPFSRCLSSLMLLLLLVGGCGRSGPTEEAGDNSSEQVKSEANAVTLPDDPFFADNTYPGTTANDVLTMGNATSVWFKTTDDFSKVVEFYTAKFQGGNNHVEAERAYFTRTKPEGGGYGATATKQPDGSTQIILKVERP